jgi:3-dehydroquinate synthase
MTAGVTRITVGGNPDGSTYDVVVGADLMGELPGLLGPGVLRVAVVHPASMRRLATAIAARLDTAGCRSVLAEVPDGEAAKAASVAAGLWSLLGRSGFTRSDAVVAVGGGATTDLAGFVAATWLRGVRVVHVPTTVLAMVDAAVGGKTGIDTAEGKNLVGAFHPPAGVLCDLTLLDTLPPGEYASGLAEVVKAGFIADPAVLDLLEGGLETAAAHIGELVVRAVRVKADVVSGDLRESGRREILNYGHTLGHAIERAEAYRWRHGDAISVGMVYAAELAQLAGRLDAAVVERHRSILSGLGLPTAYRGDRWDTLLSAMKVDKKSRGDVLRFVVLDGVGKPGLFEGPDAALLADAYRKVST